MVEWGSGFYLQLRGLSCSVASGGEGVAVEGGEVNSCGGCVSGGCESLLYRIVPRVETGKPCWKGYKERGVREQ